MFQQKRRTVAFSILLLLASCTRDKVIDFVTQQSADSHQFVYTTCSGIWVADQDGMEILNVVNVNESGYRLCPAGFSDDGTRVAYWTNIEDQVGLWISDTDSWNPRLVSGEWPVGFDPAGIRWGANPNLVFVMGYGESPGLFAVNLNTGQRENWGRLRCPLIGVSPRTNQFAGWISTIDSTGRLTVEVIETDGSHWQSSEPLPSNLVDFDSCATYTFPVLDTERDAWSWSPDHKRIAVMDYAQSPPSIVIIGIPVNELGNLIVDRLLIPNPASFLTWSPQGQHIAFESTCTYKNENCVFVLELQSREIIWEGEGHSPLYWHPDGTKLLFNLDTLYFPHYNRNSPQIGLWSLDLPTLEASRLLTTPVDALTWLQSPVQTSSATP